MTTIPWRTSCRNSSTTIIAAENTVRNNAADLICTGTDDQYLINDVIVDLPSTGGRILFLDGTYNIDTLTVNDVGTQYNGIYINRYADYCSITLEGENLPWSTAYSAYAPSGGVWFKTNPSAYTGHATDVCNTIGTPYGEMPMASFPGQSVQLKNLYVTVPSQTINKSAIDLEYVTGAQLDSVRAMYDGNAGAPPLGTYGIKLPWGGKIGPIVLLNCVAYGFQYGMALQGEHFIGIGCFGIECTYPYIFNAGNGMHTNSILNCGEQWCPNGPVFAGDNGALIDLIGYDIEFKLAGWYSRVAGATETNPGYMGGTITYSAVKAGVGLTELPFWAPGYGHKFTTYEGLASRTGITSNRPVNPGMLQQFYDTTLNKPIWWNGTNWVDATGTSV